MLRRWNPWQELYDMQRETAELMRRFFGRGGGLFPALEGGANGRGWTPAIDVFTRDSDLVVRAELPGIDPEKDIDISFQDGLLAIRGERRHEERSEKGDFYRFESSYGSFQRTVPLPEGVNPDDVRATYEKGILEIVVPQAAQLSAPKRIPIGIGKERKALSTKGRKR